MSGTNKHLNKENIEYIYSGAVLNDGEPTHTHSKDTAF